ncbi:hypothetical protein SAMN05444285_102192 [Draconibacterium orientale]|uniref:PKD domain-containing protein n=2 Tax=Draconibacterium orientale TaxID=1168034 RepID=A0A1H9ZLS4_9BACT|nr:hypothetical protein [Draconibacterium orientale]SES82577.1 hypothetical protein SAMN05444285_102192 [Draconibacterium orientale]
MKKTLTYLIASIAFIVLSGTAMAQEGLTPFVGSTHVYSVDADDATNNTLEWSVVEGTPGNDYTISDGDTETATVLWKTAGTYKLQFSETAIETGCITTKEVTIVVGENTFDVSTSNPLATCNAADGQVNYASNDATTSIKFTVNMATGTAGFNPNWEITFTLSPGTGATIANVAASEGTLSGSGPYTITGITSATGTGTVDITMDVTGDIYTVLDVDLEITSATELTYKTSDVDSDDWTAIQTINAIPNTSEIRAN